MFFPFFFSFFFCRPSGIGFSLFTRWFFLSHGDVDRPLLCVRPSGSPTLIFSPRVFSSPLGDEKPPFFPSFRVVGGQPSAGVFFPPLRRHFVSSRRKGRSLSLSFSSFANKNVECLFFFRMYAFSGRVDCSPPPTPPSHNRATGNCVHVSFLLSPNSLLDMTQSPPPLFSRAARPTLL